MRKYGMYYLVLNNLGATAKSQLKFNFKRQYLADDFTLVSLLTYLFVKISR